jgi:ankyrin repeat protein
MAEYSKDIFDLVRHGDLDALNDALTSAPELAESVNAEGASLLSFAIYSGHPELAKAIRKRRTSMSPFEAIICRGGTQPIREALDAGWDPNSRAPDGFTALALACFFNNGGAVELLLPLVRDINARAENPQQVAAIHAAAAARSNDAVESLLRAGADPNLPQQGGFRPLHTAAQNGDLVMTGLLLLAGANPALPADNGKFAADFAREAGHVWLAERLEAFNTGREGL